MKQSGQSDKVYYICADNLGSILKLVDTNGASVFEATYDAWGKQTVTKNTIGFHRGYTGHEMMPEFGLVNMNGRLYDPVLGRFLSPDNYVQLPDFSQNFNRYSYCLNNPLKYTDPDGDFFHLIIGAIIGGSINLIMNSSKVDNFWQGLGYFGVGAVAGALSAGIGSGVNVAMAGGSFGAGFMGTAAGVSSTGFIAGAATGAASGFSSSFVTGSGNAWLSGSDFGNGLLEGLKSGGVSAIAGGITGGVSGGIDALSKGTNFWTGKAKLNLPEFYTASGYAIGEKTVTGKFVGKFEGENVFESKRLGDIKSSYSGITIPERGIIVGKGVYTSGLTEGKAMLQHEFGHILQYRQIGAKAYYSVIAPESLASAVYLGINPSHSHYFFWTETWANYLSKGYFGRNWLGFNYPKEYPAQNISLFNLFRIKIARILP